jgi:uncharacterized protein
MDAEERMMTTSKPTIRQMPREEIHALLARNHVGRIAYARGNRIDIEPISYVYSDGWIYGRTSRGTRQRTTGEHWWPVAFEVDEVKDHFNWKSVVVHGGYYTLSPTGAAWERAERERAVEVLRTLIPETFTVNDPTPNRDLVFRIAVQEVSGRMSSTDPVELAEPESGPDARHADAGG